MDVALDNDKAVQQDAAQQSEHAKAVGDHNVAGDHSSATEDAHPHLMSHKDNGPEHEEPALHSCVCESHEVSKQISGLPQHVI